METAGVLGDFFHVQTVVEPCLREWSADASGIPQDQYVALEARAWADLEFVPPAGESLRMASRRCRACVEGIAARHPDETVAVSGHGTLFSLLTADLKGVRPTSGYKASIGFGHAAILRGGSRLDLVRDFAGYGANNEGSKPL